MARITRDGRNVVVQAFIQDHVRREFVLSQATSIELPPLQNGLEIVHIAWSHTGNDLAVVDSSGGLFMFLSVPGQLNRMNPGGKYASEQSGVSCAVVGLEWLNITTNRPVYHELT